MEFSKKYNFTESDSKFDKIYPTRYQDISKIHWTPVEVVKTAINWLEGNEPKKILDIGSGVGKFCVIGSILSKFTFVGVEKRKNLVRQSRKAATFFKTKNVSFINDNITNINFQEFDAFYYFNPFCEQIAYSNWIDQKPDFSEKKYKHYEDYVIRELSAMPIGTKVITYCSDDLQLANSYRLKNMMFNGLLLLWVKEQ
jgi:SAM-dependent methyltransferase